MLADVLVLLWVLLACWLGVRVHDGFGAVADQVEKVQSAGTGLSGGLNDAGETLAQTPLVGDEIASPFQSAAGSSDDIAQAGGRTADSLRALGTGLGVLLALVLLAVVLPWWLPGRIRFVVTATIVRRWQRQGGDLDLLALRALAHQPLARLVRGHGDAVRRWREADTETIHALAALELRDLGLAPRAANGRAGAGVAR